MTTVSQEAEKALARPLELLVANIFTSALVALFLIPASGSEPFSSTTHHIVLPAQPYVVFTVFLVHAYISSLVAHDVLLGGLNHLLVCYPYLALIGFESLIGLFGMAGTAIGMLVSVKTAPAGGVGGAFVSIKKRCGRRISLEALLAYMAGYSFMYSTMLISLTTMGIFSNSIVPLLKAYSPTLFALTLVAGLTVLYLGQGSGPTLLSGLIAGAGPVGLVPSIIITLSPSTRSSE